MLLLRFGHQEGERERRKAGDDNNYRGKFSKFIHSSAFSVQRVLRKAPRILAKFLHCCQPCLRQVPFILSNRRARDQSADADCACGPFPPTPAALPPSPSQTLLPMCSARPPPPPYGAPYCRKLPPKCWLYAPPGQPGARSGHPPSCPARK